jgi:hypothetical protein
MENLKFIEAITTFSNADWKEFNSYVHRNKPDRTDTIHLFDLIYKSKKNFNLANIRSIYFKHLPEKLFSNLLSNANKVILDFWVWQELKENELLYKSILIRKLSKKGLFKHVNYVANKLESEIKNQSQIDENLNLLLGELNHIKYYFGNPSIEKNELEVLLSVIDYCLSSSREKFSMYKTELINMAKIKGKSQQEDVIDRLNKLDNINDQISSTPLSTMYDKIGKLYQNEESEIFYELKEILFSNQLKKENESFDLLSKYLAVLARRMYMNGKLKDKEAVISIHQYNIENEINMKNGKMTIIAFHNLVNVFANMFSFDDTTNLIQQLLPKVAVKNQKMTLNLALAQNCFTHKRYSEIIGLTRNTSFDNAEQKYRALTLKMLALYTTRLESYDILNVSISNLKRSLNRVKDNFPNIAFRSYMNLFEIIIKLTDRDFDAKNKIDIKQYDYIMYRVWVEEQLALLKSNN